MTGKQRLVLQVGDVAGVAAELTNGLLAHTKWAVQTIGLAEPSGGGKVRRLLEVPRRGLRARHLIQSAVAEHNPDVVHVHWARYAPFIGSTNTPLVVHAHGSDLRGRSKTVSGRLVLAALARADAIVVSTPDLLEDLGGRGQFLPNPVDTTSFAPGPGRLKNRNTRPTVFLFSQLIDVKGAPTLLESARLMRATIPNVRIIAIRGGTYDADASAAGVDLMPRQSRSQLAGLLRCVDVVVGQMRLGCLGLSELESMSSGRPLVTFLRGEFYPPDVPVVSATSAEQVAHECSRLLNDEDLARTLGLSARSYILERHDSSVVTRQLVAIYEGVM